MVAVTEPLVAAGPNADTQSPTARSPEVADRVVFTGVELDVVTLSVSVLGFAGRLELPLDAEKVPGEIAMPETVSVDPSTAVTLPDAMSRLPSRLPKLLPAAPPPGKVRGPPSGKFCGPPPDPLRNWNPPAGGPPEPVPARKVPAPPVAAQVPALFGIDNVMLRAAMVVLDFFDAEPVAVTQSPTVTELTDSVRLLENVVVDVQLTVVWPLFGF